VWEEMLGSSVGKNARFEKVSDPRFNFRNVLRSDLTSLPPILLMLTLNVKFLNNDNRRYKSVFYHLSH
jgi:hypothetical protein